MHKNIVSKMKEKQKYRRRWKRIASLFVVLALCMTSYMLMLPAITQETATYCGKEEHKHGDECYEKVLICEKEEHAGSEEEIHTHTDSCYKESEILTCSEEEVEGGHTHGTECYQTEHELICTIPEKTEKVEGHTHTDACWERKLICNKAEHTHEEMCYSNPDADVETEETTTEESKTEEPEAVRTEYFFEDEHITVTATLEFPDAIPDDAELQVRGIDPKEESCEKYLAALNQDEKQTYSKEASLFYDIGFYKEGTEYQPERGKVSIVFQFKEPTLRPIVETVEIIHLPVRENKVVKEYLNVAIKDEEAAFEMNDFSVIAFAVPAGEEPASADTRGESTAPAPGRNISYREILGNAAQFGIVAERISRIGHMDTTFATNVVISDGGDVTTGRYTGNGAGGSMMIGEVDGRIAINGSSTGVYTPKSEESKIQLSGGSYFVTESKTEIASRISQTLAYVRSQSQSLAAERTYNVLKYENNNGTVSWIEDPNNKILDISSLPGGTYYFDGDNFIGKDDIRIIKNSNQKIVFHLSKTNVILKRFRVEHADTGHGTGSDSTGSVINEFVPTIIFNMPNAQSVSIESAVIGILIAPDAEVHIRSTSSGWMVAKYADNPAGEWHFTNQDLPESIQTGIEAQKLVDGQTPTEEESFRFRVEDWVSGVWVESMEIQNTGRNLSFQKTFAHPGTHYYRISEIREDNEAYRYDTASFIIKVTITETTENGRTVLRASKTYYQADSVDEISDSNRVEQITFKNKTSEDAGFELPETGGIGIHLYMISGLFLILAAGMTLIKIRRK